LIKGFGGLPALESRSWPDEILVHRAQLSQPFLTKMCDASRLDLPPLSFIQQLFIEPPAGTF